MRTHAGLTLVELLVAMSVFLFLGGAMVLFLRIGVDTWRIGEIRRESYERSQSILDQLEDDLACTFSDPTRGTGGLVDVILLSDYGPGGRQRLRFVRSLAGEMRHPITQRAGSLTSGRMELDYHNDALEAEIGFLRAPGGLQEVAYVMDPDLSQELLWRGVKSPIGGLTTLFDDENIYEPADLANPDSPFVLRRLRPWAAGIMHVEFNFWGQDTEAWQGEQARSKTHWDSTRGILDEEISEFFRPDSRDEARDDVFPSRVQVVLVLRPARATRFARLRRAISASDTAIPVDTSRYYPDGAFQYIRIGQEWIRYDSKSSKEFVVARDGRGARGSLAADHAAGSLVVYGATFSRVIRIPGARTSNWSER